MKLKRPVLAVIIGILLVCSLPTIKAKAFEEKIYIKTPQDIISLAENCRYNAWSEGKEIILSNDIDLIGLDFEHIPYFGGSFDGKGHTIKGLFIDEKLSPCGLFGIIGQGGEVKNLNVEGVLSPSGDKSKVGGIAGVNAGLIENASFKGDITGEYEIGGIVGENELTGTIKNCSGSGEIMGRKMTGGMAGCNQGLIEGCNNSFSINIDSTDPAISIDSIASELNGAISARPDIEDIYKTIVDTGGIAGFSDGIILNCNNFGDIGYPHIGYSIGGIAGRNQGYIYSCENTGTINGRREIGGVVGQAEPYVNSVIPFNKLGSLRSEINTLNSLMNKAINDAKNSSNAISGRLEIINESMADATDKVYELFDRTGDFIDDNLKEVNRIGEVLNNAVSDISNITEKLPDINKKVTEALGKIQETIGYLKDIGVYSDGAINGFSSAADNLNIAVDILNDAQSKINKGISIIQKVIGDALNDVMDDHKNINLDKDALNTGIEYIKNAIDILENGNDKSNNKGVFYYISDAIEDLENSITMIERASDEVTLALDKSENAVAILKNISQDITGIIYDIDSLMDYLSNVDKIQASLIKDNTKVAGNELHSSLLKVNAGVSNLNIEANNASELLLNDLNDISLQLNRILNMMLDEVSGVTNQDSYERIMDTSEEDINSTTEGKLLLCVNRGRVEGDIDVGGIAGSMGIFDEANPEGENAEISPYMIGRKYELKAILQSCTNYGQIESKKDYAGAVCGMIKLGVITDCKGFGSVKSQSGNYVGGIAGGNCAMVKNSYSRCFISGGSYVGGIVGSNISDNSVYGSVNSCVSMVNIEEASQFYGAVCGADIGDISNNRFYSESLDGINNISYSNRAWPITYDEVTSIENIPAEFKGFKVNFLADDNVVNSFTLDYRDSFSKDRFPDIPIKEGMYGKWDIEDINDVIFDVNVNAAYYPWITALDSEDVREDNRPIFVAIGNFTDSDKLLASEKESDFDGNGGLFTSTKEISQWDVSLGGNDEENTLRFLPSSDDGKATKVYLKTGSAWKEVNVKDVGSYIEFCIPRGDSELVVISYTSYFIPVICIIATIGILLILLLIKYQRRDKRLANGKIENERRQ